MKRLWWLVVDLWHGIWPEPDLVIDLKRINDEDRTTRRHTCDDDLEYRQKVMKRMMRGLTKEQLPPLVTRRRVKKRKIGKLVPISRELAAEK